MRQRIIIILGIAMAALIVVGGALGSALTTTATVSGTAGVSLAQPATASISDTLTGADQTVSYAPLLGVADARGTGAGWNLQIAATNFDDGSGHTLAPGAISAVSAACVGGSACTGATNVIGYPLTVIGTATKFYNAATATGMGKVNVTPTVDVTIPGNAYAGTYTSTVTLAVVSGP